MDPYREQECRVQTQTHRKDGHGKTEAETGMMPSHAMEGPRLPEAGRGKEESFLRDCGEITSADTFNFGLPASATGRE